jgi:hypothetical protein
VLRSLVSHLYEDDVDQSLIGLDGHRLLLHTGRHGSTSRVQPFETQPVFSIHSNDHDFTREYSSTIPPNKLERITIRHDSTSKRSTAVFWRHSRCRCKSSSDTWVHSRIADSDAVPDEVTCARWDNEEITNSGRQRTESAGFDRILLSSSELGTVSGRIFGGKTSQVLINWLFAQFPRAIVEIRTTARQRYI